MIFFVRYKILFLMMISLFSGSALASTEMNSTVNQVFSSDSLYQLMGSFVTVFLLMFAVAYLVKKINPLNSGLSKQFKVISVLPLGTKQKAALVQVGEQQILLGISQENVNTLHVLPMPLEVESLDSGSERASLSQMSFKSFLSFNKKIMS